MTSHILVPCGLLCISQLYIRLGTHELEEQNARSEKQQPQQGGGCLLCSLHLLQWPCPLGFPGYLLDPFRHSKMNLKPLQSEQGGSQRGSGKGGMERGIRIESKSREVCSPLVCNFQNDSRTGAKVRESKALAPQPAVAGKPGARRTPAHINQQ